MNQQAIRFGVVLLTMATCLSAQPMKVKRDTSKDSVLVSTDSLVVKKISGSYQFYKDGKRVSSYSQLITVMEPNALACQEMKSAISSGIGGSILVSVGISLMTGPIVKMMNSDVEPKWVVPGIGAGLLALSIPLYISGGKKGKNACKTFISGLKSSSFLDQKELHFSMNGNNVGLTLSF